MKCAASVAGRRLVAGFALCWTVGVTGACRSAPAKQGTTHAVVAGAPVPADVGMAEVFSPGVISNGLEQWRLTFSPDARTVYFASSEQFFPFSRKATIYESHFDNGKWTTPEVAPFSGQYSDIDPFITPDGQRLYFSSIRPVDGVIRGDVDLWMLERTISGWSEPIHLGPEVNSAADELYPSSSADGTLYFASGPRAPTREPRLDEQYDIYSAERAGDGFAARQALGAGVNTAHVAGGGPQAAWEFNPEISADGQTLVFTSLRPGGYGLGDLYVSQRVNGTWSMARNLGPLVNTAADEFHPTLSRNQRDLYFVRRVHPGDGNFYTIPTRGLRIFSRE